MSRARLAIHGHFYQPPRYDPFSDTFPADPTAAPARDWNSRILDECYAPNAAAGNFGRIGFDLGPTLGNWLRRERPDLHDSITAQETGRNGLAQPYHHPILPLASARDRRTEIRWGLRDFELRFGHRPAGLWLPETAVDLLTLRICAEEGVRYTILAPAQAAPEPLESRRAYRIDLGGGQAIAVLFYDGVLSTALSFQPASSEDADRFACDEVLPRLSEPLPDGRAPLVLLATDGELYGHHQRFRDHFLARLTSTPYPFDVCTTGDLLGRRRSSRLPPIAIRERTSWSCHHGVARWSGECPDALDGRWKAPLRAALDRLSAGVDAVAEERARSLGLDLWALRDRYVDVASGYSGEAAFIERALAAAVEGAPARAARLSPGEGAAELLCGLLCATRSRLAMFASDAWYWDDPTRPETAAALRFAAHAARLVDRAAGTTLEERLVEDLAALRWEATGSTGVALYRRALESVGQPARVPRSISSVEPIAGTGQEESDSLVPGSPEER